MALSLHKDVYVCIVALSLHKDVYVCIMALSLGMSLYRFSYAVCLNDANNMTSHPLLDASFTDFR